MRVPTLGLAILVSCGGFPSESAATDDQPVVHHVLADKPTDLMLHYFQGLARNLPPQRSPAADVAEWQQRRAEIRSTIRQSMGDFPFDARPPLNPKITGTIDGDGYVIEKVLYESLPGLYVTALLYRPKTVPDRVPAVMCLNGHWPEAKFTDHIQQRCTALAKMGVIAFCQDVIGTGERGAPAGSPHPTYHGNYRGGVAQIVGRSLFGYELFECLRAVDYLESRAEVDPRRIICTGASGGGMQSMFLPALDDRLAGAVPVCYVSSYQAHMGATACVGEIPRGVLSYTNQWELLAMHAPRPLLCIAAARDVSWFQPVHTEEAARHARSAAYRLYGKDDAIHVATVDAPHSYNQEMRELLYNFVAANFLGATSPTIKEPAGLPVRSRTELTVGLPEQSETIASLTFKGAANMAAAIPTPHDANEWQQQRIEISRKLSDRLVLTARDRKDSRASRVRTFDWNGGTVEHWTIEPEPGVIVPLVLCLPAIKSDESPRPAVVIVDETGKQIAFERGLVKELLNAGNIVLAIDCRGTGETAGTVPAYNYEDLGMEDYNLANYGLIVGRPFIGMQVHDVLCAVDFLAARPEVDARRISLAGRGRGAFAAMLATSIDPRIHAVVLEEMLTSYVFPREFKGIGLSYFVPKILEAGDIEHIAACVSPRPLLMLNPVTARREPLEPIVLGKSFGYTRNVYGAGQSAQEFTVEQVNGAEVPAKVAAWIKAAVQSRERSAAPQGRQTKSPSIGVPK